MHDVVCHVAKSMTSEMYFVKAGGEKLEEWPNIENLKRYTAISIMQNQIPEYPASWDGPNLQTLLLRDNSNSQLPMPEGVLKGMKTLKVLANISAYGNLELAIGHLTNLRTLILQDYIVRDTNALGELKLLEILSFKGSRFTVPPYAIRNLTSLKLVDLENCSHPPHTDSILPFNVISKLSKVQELYMWPSRTSLFDRFGVFEWFSITELKSLPRLTAFTIVINNFNRIPEGFSFPNLKVFKMSTGEGFCTDCTLTFKWPSLEKVEVALCPQMQMFTAVVASDGDSSTPKLKMIKVDGVNIMLDGTDINRVMQGHYRGKGTAGPSN
ncbi:hypothetical protein GH714_012981 [Hevea brasiliensis]|uniref:Uncharacterized protein n=1 Tax=Hevea brasiliensis TaxID=3981 RepID=A0A6A6MZ09_HEVBR|nr:hypothetical protein GH714_012981 [Hevea brasiliensis]